LLALSIIYLSIYFLSGCPDSTNFEVKEEWSIKVDSISGSTGSTILSFNPLLSKFRLFRGVFLKLVVIVVDLHCFWAFDKANKQYFLGVLNPIY